MQSHASAIGGDRNHALSTGPLHHAEAENQLADFACGWKVEQGPRNKVLAVELWFRPKDQTGRMAAARELDETRDGRKARRDGQATPTRLQPDLVEALAALRDGRLPPSTAE